MLFIPEFYNDNESMIPVSAWNRAPKNTEMGRGNRERMSGENRYVKLAIKSSQEQDKTHSEMDADRSAAWRHSLGLFFTFTGLDAAGAHFGHTALVLCFLFDGCVFSGGMIFPHLPFPLLKREMNNC